MATQYFCGCKQRFSWRYITEYRTSKHSSTVALTVSAGTLTIDFNTGHSTCHTGRVGGNTSVGPTILWDNTGDLQLRHSHENIRRNGDTLINIAEDYSILQPGELRRGRARRRAGEDNVLAFNGRARRD